MMPFTVRLDAAHFERLEAERKRLGLSRSAYVQQALRGYWAQADLHAKVDRILALLEAGGAVGRPSDAPAVPVDLQAGLRALLDDAW
jgi:predicted transcriptional regulator